MKPLYPHIKKIAIGSDHAGFEYKEIITNELTHQNLTIQDFGTFNKTYTILCPFLTYFN